MFREGPSEVSLVKMDSKAATKIKDGVEAENLGNAFDNVRGDVKVRGGKWFYEVKLSTNGKIHIGWCTSKCNIATNAYTGIGNDDDSWAYDGSSQRSYHGSSGNNNRYGEYWNQNDVIGTILDLENKTISFYRNGNDMGVAFSNVEVGDGIYPAISLQKKQKITANFGKQKFKYALNEVFPDVHPLHLNLTKDQQSSLEKLFDKYKTISQQAGDLTDNEDVIKSSGVLQYSQDLGITEESDPGIMVISWKLNVNSQKCWEFTKDEFVGGWAIHGIYSIDGMKKKLKEWKDELKQPAKYKGFYYYVFDYLREDKKILGMEEAITLWGIIGMSDRWPLFPKWLEFLKDKKAVSRDTWRLFYSFVEQYPKDVKEYDSDGCWPSMIDEFVEYVKEQSKN